VIALPFLSFLLLVTDAQAMVHPGNLQSDLITTCYKQSDHFWAASYKHFFPAKEELDIYADSYISDYDNAATSKIASFKYTDPENYPFCITKALPMYSVRS